MTSSSDSMNADRWSANCRPCLFIRTLKKKGIPRTTDTQKMFGGGTIFSLLRRQKIGCGSECLRLARPRMLALGSSKKKSSFTCFFSRLALTLVCFADRNQAAARKKSSFTCFFSRLALILFPLFCEIGLIYVVLPCNKVRHWLKTEQNPVVTSSISSTCLNGSETSRCWMM